MSVPLYSVNLYYRRMDKSSNIMPQVWMCNYNFSLSSEVAYLSKNSFKINETTRNEKKLQEL